jgi:hypothetical protein
MGFKMKMLKNIFSVVPIKTNLEINFSLPRMFFAIITRWLNIAELFLAFS